jgi:DNA-binding FadR family transcriptional regulator
MSNNMTIDPSGRAAAPPPTTGAMPLSSPTRAETLSLQVARQIESLITSGAWPVGSRIPAEKDLVSQLLVSRNTVREALRSLVHTGMIEARVGDGTYVRAPSELAAPLMRRVQRGRLHDAIEVRAALEKQVAHLAALRRTTDEVSQLRDLLATQQAAVAAGDRAAYTETDAAFHRAVVACARNELLAEIYEHLGGALKPSFVPDLWDQTLAAEEIDYHVALVDAIEASDPAAAEASAATLIDILKNALLPPDGRTQ